MKKTITLIICIVMGIVSGYAEPVYCYAHAVSTRLPSGEWSKWKMCNVKICIDEVMVTIQAKAKPQQKYTIYETDMLEQEGNYLYIAYYCVDMEGKQCCLRFRTYIDEDGNGQLQFYIQYADAVWVYDITER